MATGTAIDPARTYDVVMLRGLGRSGLLAQRLDTEDGGAAVTGITKLAQAVVLVLLTARGSVPHDPEWGTDLVPQIATGRMRSDIDVHMAFQFAAGTAASLLRARAPKGAPDDERLAEAVLERVALRPGRVDLTVRVRSVAGEARDVIVPVALAP